jgi:predicted nuclease of restriction endonuclease-like RecB superfamily
MLTKDLMKFRRSGETIKPVFIAVDDPVTLELASELLAVYRLPEDGLPPTRGELEEIVEPLLNAHKDVKMAKGFNKLILDRCKFTIPLEFDYSGLRQKLFTHSATLLSSGMADLEEYRRQLLESVPDAVNIVASGIYADLPHNETLVAVKTMFTKELLERYNCSQVQALLFYCSDMLVEAEDPDPAEMRRLFKYLKFFRLLAQVKTMPEGKDEQGHKTMRIQMRISGPASIFENSRKYGLQLATFFPAVCLLKKWLIKAEIDMDGKKYKLRLDCKSNLVSHYRNFSAYVPEEVAMFHRLFKEKIQDWQIIGDTPFFDAGNQEIIFADLSFKNSGGKIIHLELFHRWHATPLLKRLEYCAKYPDMPFIIGVDRSLSERPEVKQFLDSSDFFQKKGFLFRDFPGVERVYKLLESGN